jgi:hypothetical protein
MNTLGASILIFLTLVVVCGSPRWALTAAAAGILYLTQSQQVSVAGFNLYALRIIELAAFVRVIVRRELYQLRLNEIDRIFIVFNCYTTGVFLLRSHEDYAFEIGRAVDAFLSYFAFRALLRDADTLKWFLGSLAILLVPFALLVVDEGLTSQNPFAAIGGVELVRAGDLWFREGRLRATGSFGHPSLMGTLGGTLLPVYVGAWFAGASRWTASVGIVASLVIVWASNSGGPATCVVVAVAGLMLWPFREQMQWVRRSLAIAILGLALVMKAPIWYLPAKISDLTGGDGYHRSALLDAAIHHLNQWWFVGMRALDTSNWLPYTNTNTGAVDMTNQFLLFGITAGLPSMILLIVLLVRVYKQIGRVLIAARSSGAVSPGLEALAWGLGVMIVVHISNWFGISYWDQSNVLWFLQLAMVSSVTTCAMVSTVDNIATANGRVRTVASGFNPVGALTRTKGAQGRGSLAPRSLRRPANTKYAV